jgi:CheY-like chemotaxis protein
MYRIKFRISQLNLQIATGGYQGLDIAKKEKPDLILLDIKMDDLDGFEVLKRLKSDPTLKDIPVFLLTNMSEKEASEKGKQLGAERYVMKAKETPEQIIGIVTDRVNQI